MRHENTPDLWDTAPAEYFTEGGGPIRYGCAPSPDPETLPISAIPAEHSVRPTVLSDIAWDGFSLVEYEGRMTHFVLDGDRRLA